MRSILVLILSFLGGTAATAGDTGWPQWGGPQRDFRLASRTKVKDWQEAGPAVAWTRELGAGYAGIVGDGKRVYSMTRRGDQEVAVAFAAKDGRTVWEHAYHAPVQKRPDIDTSWGAGPDSTPLLTDGLLLTLGFTGKVHALDAATGEVRWSRDLVGESGGSIPYFGISPSPIRVGDLAIFFAGRAFGIDVKTGEVRWRNDEFTASYASPIVTEEAGKPVVVAGVAGEVVGFDPTDGKLLWRVEHANQHRTILNSPIAADDGWVFASAYFLGSIGLRRGDDGTYEKRWETPHLQLSHSNSIRIGQTVFGFHNSILTAIDVPTGEIVWRERGLQRGNFIRAGERTLVLGEKGDLQVLKLDRAGVTLQASARLLEGRTWAAPALIGSRLYARDTDAIVAVDLDRRAAAPAAAPQAVTVALDEIDAETGQAFLAAKRALSQAYYRSDAEGLESSRRTFGQWTDHPRLGHLADYYIGFAYWQQSLFAPREQRLLLTDRAVEHLNRATERERWFADAHALLGTIYPAYYRLSPQKAAVIAMKGDEHLDVAARLTPNDPRVLAIRGLDLLMSPVDHGGDPAAGIAGMEKALQAFATAPAENSGLDPDWGHAMVLTWYGQALLASPDARQEEGERAVRQALQIAPNFAFAKSLVPDDG